jgi:hypothetical protein
MRGNQLLQQERDYCSVVWLAGPLSLFDTILMLSSLQTPELEIDKAVHPTADSRRQSMSAPADCRHRPRSKPAIPCQFRDEETADSAM